MKKVTHTEQDGMKKINRAGRSVPLLQSLFLDGKRAHVRLRLPLAGITGSSGIPGAALLMTDSAIREIRDLEPRDGDLVPFTFRLLSAAYLGSAGYHLDFSREGVLERALPVFMEPEVEGSVRQGPLVVVRDHSFAIEDRIGLVRNVRWSPSETDRGLVHPGIDAELYIDWKLAGEAVRRLLHDPPLLDACSVSLGFSWEKSHPNLEDGQFWMQLGEELDGSPVRIVVTEILTVEHVGLVYAGADASARRRKPVEGEPGETIMSANLSGSAGIHENEGEGGLSPNETAIPLPDDSAVWDLLGIDQPDAARLEERIRELMVWSALGREAHAELLREVEILAIRLDGTLETGASQSLFKPADGVDTTTLRALKLAYTRRLEALLPARCQVCGSEQVSRRSSQEASLASRSRCTDDPRFYE